MRIAAFPRESTMALIIEGKPEIRFTPGGQRLATWYASTTGRMYFQQWEDPDTLRRLSEYQRDTGEYEGDIDKLLELPADAEILVVGRCQIQEFKPPRGGVPVRSNVFTVREWVYAGWDWKKPREATA
jgi:hypothetical protein